MKFVWYAMCDIVRLVCAARASIVSAFPPIGMNRMRGEETVKVKGTFNEELYLQLQFAAGCGSCYTRGS